MINDDETIRCAVIVILSDELGVDFASEDSLIRALSEFGVLRNMLYGANIEHATFMSFIDRCLDESSDIIEAASAILENQSNYKNSSDSGSDAVSFARKRIIKMFAK